MIWNNEITNSYENTNIQDYFLLLFFKTLENSANINIFSFAFVERAPLSLLWPSSALMDLCYNFHHLLVVCFGLFVGLFLTTSTDFARNFHIFTFVPNHFFILIWVWMLVVRWVVLNLVVWTRQQA